VFFVACGVKRMDSILFFCFSTGSTGFIGFFNSLFAAFSHRRWIEFHQFLTEIDENKKYPDNPVYPVLLNIIK